MNGLLTFCVFFLTCAIGAAGAAKLIYLVIQPGEWLGRYQWFLLWLGQKNKFWYKRLGGCVICFRQTIAEISFVVLSLIFCQYFHWPINRINLGGFIFSWIVRALANYFMYVCYCGVVLSIGQLLEQRQIPATSDIRKEYPNEEIIEQNGL